MLWFTVGVPKIRAGSVAEHRELMWTALLDAFGELLQERGYADLTLAEVAARAGMARNTIYNYAVDKEALLMAYIGRAVDAFVGEVRAEIARLPDARARLGWLIKRQMHQFTEQRGGGSDRSMLDTNALGPSGHVDLQHRLEPLHALLHDIIRDGAAAGEFRTDLDLDATLPMVFAVMASERVPVGMGHHDPDAAADRVTDFVLRALSSGPL